jgi:hypothetical protein
MARMWAGRVIGFGGHWRLLSGYLFNTAFENVASRGDGMSDLKAPTYKFIPSSGLNGRASIPS